MRKLFAIGTLLLSSAAVFASPAVTVNRNYNQTVNHGYVAPVPAPVVYGDRARFAREEKARLERMRLERLRRERELARLRLLRHYDNRW
jgi:hypothetical protein